MSFASAIYGCKGRELNDREKRFFREARPWGFILFSRNADNPEQLRRLTASLREAVGYDAPILIDQASYSRGMKGRDCARPISVQG